MFPIFSRLQGKPDQLFLTQQKLGVRKSFQFYSPSNVVLQGQGGLADTVDRSIDLMSRIEIHLAEHGTFHDKIIKYLLSQHYIIPGYREQPSANQRPSLRSLDQWEASIGQALAPAPIKENSPFQSRGWPPTEMQLSRRHDIIVIRLKILELCKKWQIITLLSLKCICKLSICRQWEGKYK